MLEARIVELVRLLEESRRSGKRQAAPFSKGEPKADPKTPGRKSGAAHGRHGHRMTPALAPDRTLDTGLPGCCPECGGAVAHECDDEQFHVEVPEPTAVVTRFVVRIGRCEDCGHRVQGHHPEQTSDALGAAGTQLGPRAKSLATWLHYGLGLSFAKAASVLGQLGVGVTPGALASGAQSMGSALVSVHEEIIARVNDADSITSDETGWRVAGRRAWLWGVATEEATAYEVAPGRSFEDATRLINEDYSGVLVRDGYVVYRQFESAAHQTCLAHLLRRCHEMIVDGPADEREVPEAVKDILMTALGARGAPRRTRRALARDLINRTKALARTEQPCEANRRLLDHLMAERSALFTFLTVDGIEATNWRGEQAMRPAVVNRKVFGGNRTWRGAATQSRIMSVLRTTAQRQMDPIDYLVRVARATADEPRWLFFNTA